MMSSDANDGKSNYERRDLVGYGNYPPNPQWPKRAKVALNFVIHYEEGGENCLLHESKVSPNDKNNEIHRDLTIESLYEYGPRVGFWNLYRLFARKKMVCTVFASGMALQNNQQVCGAIIEANWEVASQGYQWTENYQTIDEETEKEYMKRAIQIHKNLIGKRPMGLYYPGKPSMNTRKLVVNEGGFLYDSNSYADDLPYWNVDNSKPHLIIPHTLSENDMAFDNGNDFNNHLKDTLRYLIEEGRASSHGCKMMSIGLHCHKAGKPGFAMALSNFMDYVKSFGREIWICTREDIAHHWHDNHYPKGGGTIPYPKGGIGTPTPPIIDGDDANNNSNNSVSNSPSTEEKSNPPPIIDDDDDANSHNNNPNPSSEEMLSEWLG
mmetsp:Transcript_293/g.334  ORF Transcript_293/g.334 Transcript_293/m.334 type:complete len:380 (+) Transcript_293:96-1235(+)